MGPIALFWVSLVKSCILWLVQLVNLRCVFKQKIAFHCSRESKKHKTEANLHDGNGLLKNKNLQSIAVFSCPSPKAKNVKAESDLGGFKPRNG